MVTFSKEEEVGGVLPPARRAIEASGLDVEFRADLEPHMDPISAFGYEQGKARPIFHPIFDKMPDTGELVRLNGAYLKPPSERREGRAYPRFDIMQQQTDDKVRFGDVMVDQTGPHPNETYAHEFRHRGLQRIRNAISQEDFASRYGQDAAEYLYEGAEEEDFVRSMDPEHVSGHWEGELTEERAATLSKAITDAALDLIEDERENATTRKEAVGWLRSIFGKDD